MTGSADTSNHFTHAFLYSNGQMTDLGTLPGYDSSQGNAINNVGQVTGFAYNQMGSFIAHAFLYSNGHMTDLATLPGDDLSQGYAINNAGQVVGSSYTSGGVSHAFLYSDGQMRDLNTLIDPALGITLAEADGINDQGQIVVGSTHFNSLNSHAYLLTPLATPVPEPSTLALFGVTGLMLSALALPRWFRPAKSL